MPHRKQPAGWCVFGPSDRAGRPIASGKDATIAKTVRKARTALPPVAFGLEMFIAVSLVYFAMFFPMSRYSQHLETKLDVRR